MRLLWWRMRYRIRRRLLPGLRRERLEHSYIFSPPTSRPHLSPAEARHIAAPQAPPRLAFAPTMCAAKSRIGNAGASSPMAPSGGNVSHHSMPGRFS